MKECSIAGCSNEVNARGWCRLHYQRWQRQGDPLVVKRSGSRGLTTEQRFARYISPADNGCIEWQGQVNSKGYGRFYVPGKAHWSEGRNRMTLVHRWVWEHTHGPIPEGVCVLHRCDNPRCVNVNHLSLGTQRENIIDMHRKGRDRNQFSVQA